MRESSEGLYHVINAVSAALSYPRWAVQALCIEKSAGFREATGIRSDVHDEFVKKFFGEGYNKDPDAAANVVAWCCLALFVQGLVFRLLGWPGLKWQHSAAWAKRKSEWRRMVRRKQAIRDAVITGPFVHVRESFFDRCWGSF